MNCPNCRQEVISQARFCPACGKPLETITYAEREQKENHERSGVRSVIILYFILLLVCLLLKFTHIPASYQLLNVVDVIICGAITVFAVLNFRELRPAIVSNNIRWWIFPLIATGAIGANLGVSWLVDHLLRHENDDIFYTYMYDDTMHPLLWSILGIAVQPAIFEELAFRGVMYNHLSRVMDSGAVLIVTGVLFGIMHLSPVSLIWLVPFGILAAWMRKRSGHLWYGVTFHFFFNLTYVLQEGYLRKWL